jgi:hypothetical protein
MIPKCVASVAWLLAGGCSGDGVDAPYPEAECGYREPNDRAQTAARITTADTGPAAICGSGDRDFYRFTVPDLTEIEVTIGFTTVEGDDLDVRLSDAGGGILAEARGSGDGVTILCPGSPPACPPLAGDYVLEVFPATAGTFNRYTIALTLRASGTPAAPPRP